MTSVSYVRANGLDIEVRAQYIGGTKWEPANGEEVVPANYNNNLITVDTCYGTSEFQCWSSVAEPDCFDDGGPLGPYDALSLLCQDAILSLEGEEEEIFDPDLFDDFWEADRTLDRLKDSLRETADKLMSAGLDEDMIYLIAESEDEDCFTVSNVGGREVIYPTGGGGNMLSGW